MPRRCQPCFSEATILCPSSTVVYTSAANAYRSLQDTPLGVTQVSNFLENPTYGALTQFEASSDHKCSSKANAQVYANFISAAIDCAAEIGLFPTSGATGPAITGLAPFPVPPLVQITFPVPSGPGQIIIDPALAAYLIVNIMLQQYTWFQRRDEKQKHGDRHKPDKCNHDEIAQIFSSGFQNIFTNLITTIVIGGETYRYVDITFVSAVARYTDLAAGVPRPIPIIPYVPFPVV